MTKIKIIAGIALVLLAACGGTGGTTGSGGNGGAGGSPVVGKALTITTPDYEVGAGEEKRYKCFSAYTPGAEDGPTDEETVVTKIGAKYGVGVHHVVVWQALLKEQEGQWDCPELAKPTWFPLWVGGIASTPLTMPAGAGIHIPPHSQVVIQLHLLNTTQTPIASSAELTMETSDDHTLTPAGAYGFDNRAISLPPHSSNQQTTMTCPITRDTHVFALFAHLHQRGTFVNVANGPAIGTNDVYSAPWVYDDQPITTVDFDVKKGGSFTTRCTYANPEDNTVGYGESVNAEMCSVVIYTVPWAGYGGCVNGSTL
jgi:hypothetical protein